MGTLIIFALSHALTMFLTAWLLHRQNKGLSPVPTPKSKAEVNEDPGNHEHTYERGRPTL